MPRFSAQAANYFRRTNKALWLLVIVISAYALLLIKTVPSEGRRYSYFAIQLLAVCAGMFGAVLITFFDYRTLGHFWYLIGGFCLLLMLLTFVPTFQATRVENAGGIDAAAWLKLPGGLTFQPGELLKIGFLITFGMHLQGLQERDLLDRPLHVLLLLVHVAIPMLIAHQQGDDGAAIIFFCIFLFMSFGAGIKLRYFLILLGTILVAIPILWNFVLEDYQKQRIMIFRHPEDDPLDKGLQQLAGRLSIGSGQLTGRGLFHSPRVNSSAVPVQQSDYIFSVAGEQLGFIGCVAIIVLLVLLMFVCLHTSRHANDLLGSSICMGFFGLLLSQTIFNLGMCLNLLPVMGITLPFFSAGGSSSACLYLGIGLVQSVAIHRTDRLSTRLFLDSEPL